MRKALAILAVVTAVGAATLTAPVEARGWGWGPGIGLGIAAGALTAAPGRITDITVRAITGRRITDRGRMPTAGRIIGTATTGPGNRKSPERSSGLFLGPHRD
jgi:hypothetical protein